jgi:hypothetical protein
VFVRIVAQRIRRRYAEEHSILLVLDERGRLDVSRGLDGKSANGGAAPRDGRAEMSTMIAAVGLSVTLSRL